MTSAPRHREDEGVSQNSNGYRISVDTGGTFTDVVLSDADGAMSTAKALTRFDDPWGAITEALELLVAEAGLSVNQLLARCTTFSYATTRATNAILTNSSARTAFVTTEGFPDILTLRQGGRAEPFDFSTAFPDPYVPRELTFELPGRLDSNGREVRPVDPQAAENIVNRIVDRSCEAVAVCLIWSQINPAHELAFADVLEAIAPDLPYTLSHDLNPVIREYPRASSAAIDASLKPLMQEHFRDLEQKLDDCGFKGQFLAVTAAGGCLPVDAIVERPIYAIGSGPAVAPVAARAYSAEAEAEDVIVYDTGGTSFDVSLISAGEIIISRDRWLGDQFSGHLTGIPSVAVHSIGAGGGSIAWIDEGGMLKVGPNSAGSDPGPACYGRGGAMPTVTDAAALSGYLDPSFFSGGQIILDLDAARHAVATEVAQPLGISMDHAVTAILGIANEAMVAAVREVTVNQGIDPRESLLVGGGGAGGLNIVDIARELGCAYALFPRAAGTLSAVGVQFADLIAEFGRSGVTDTANFDGQTIGPILTELSGELDDFVADLKSGGVPTEAVERAYATEARYPGQVWNLRVPLSWDGGPLSASSLDQLAERFHASHLKTYAVNDPARPVEFQHWSASAIARLPHPSLQVHLAGEASSPEVRHRHALFNGERVSTNIVSGKELEAGAEVQGPTIIEETSMTLVLPPGSSAEVTR